VWDSPKKKSSVTMTLFDALKYFFGSTKVFGFLLLISALLITLFYGIYLFNVWQIQVQKKEEKRLERIVKTEEKKERKKARLAAKIEGLKEEVRVLEDRQKQRNLNGGREVLSEADNDRDGAKSKLD